MYGVVATLLIAYRVGRPLARMWRHRFVVVGTVSEGPGVTSVYVSGRRLAELDARAGQFFMWRFLTREGWWQAHPFSLSAAPNGRWLRLTVKALGDHSAKVDRLRPGTKVLVEGPYGAFTDRRRRQAKVLFIAAGVGVTPVRAMFESTATVPGGSVFIYRAGAPGDLALRAELDDISARRQAPVHYLVGSRHDHPEYLGPDHIKSLVPDVGQREVYLCGPTGFSEMVSSSLRALGVPQRQVHTESFEL
jgi:ferredoxin-NADP reductase